MKKVTRYQCEFCKEDFKTANRHNCKKNPKLKNCFTCKHLNGWNNDEQEFPPFPDCAAQPDVYDWDINIIKQMGYNMQCEMWESEVDKE